MSTGNPSARLINETVISRLSSDSGELRKEASDALNDYTRVRMREDGFLRRILPPVTITDDELDRQVDTDKPVKIIDKEPESPGASSVPFGTLPMNRYIKGPRYRVMFDRILTEKFTKDVAELRTYDMDIRQILSDNSIKDMLAEEDGKWLATVDTIIGSANSTVPETGNVQYRTIAGGVTRDTIAEALKILPQGANHLNVATVLINNVTIFDILKFGRDEAGGDISQEMFKGGFSERELFGVRWIVTIKTELVDDGTIYVFADPKFIGKFFVYEDTTMYIDRKAYFLEFYAYESIGAAVGNMAGVGRVDFV